MASSEECPGIISIKQVADVDTPIMIHSSEPPGSYHTFGVHLSPMGIHDTQLLELMKHARQFSAAATHKSLDRADAYINYMYSISPLSTPSQ
jgi:hypothetical protein